MGVTFENKRDESGGSIRVYVVATDGGKSAESDRQEPSGFNQRHAENQALRRLGGVLPDERVEGVGGTYPYGPSEPLGERATTITHTGKDQAFPIHATAPNPPTGLETGPGKVTTESKAEKGEKLTPAEGAVNPGASSKPKTSRRRSSAKGSQPKK